MSHQDLKDVLTNREALKAVFDLLLPRETRNISRHGNATICPRTLAAIAVACWGWTDQRTLGQRMREAVTIVRRVLGSSETGSRQGVCKAMARCGDDLIAMVLEHARSRLKQLKGHWHTAGKPTFAVDGSKFAAPRTKANQQAFANTSSKKKRNKGYRKQSDASKAMSVQVLLTVFWHVGSGLPACWRLTASGGSERKNACEMLSELPPDARVVGDAEYVGYPLWSAILDSGRSFIVRVGSNVTLLKKLGYARRHNGLVYLWPDASRRKHQPPLVLRLLEVRTGRHSMWLVTNEFNLSDAQLRDLYKARWGIEVFFRTVKQNCRRAQLLCRTPENVRTELNWTLLGIWAALFVGKTVFRENGQSIGRLSPIRVMDAFAETLHAVARRQADSPLLTELLLDACKQDESKRTTSKQSHDYPCKKQHRTCGKPKIQQATTIQRTQAKKLKQQKSLPA